MDTKLLENAYLEIERKWGDADPTYMLTLGSGWGEVIENFEIIDEIDCSVLPGIEAASVTGHAGKIIRARAGGEELIVFRGRRHLYEGVAWEPIAFPVYVARRMGVQIVLLTNAAGGIGTDLESGDLMVISDHINMLGTNPLVGPHDPYWGPRFPDQSNIYDAKLQEWMKSAAKSIGKIVHSGVYVATLGPTFETPAEIRAYQSLGADAVGMSTVPEAILANSLGMRVAGISFITNLAAGISEHPLTHDEVMEVSISEMPILRQFFKELFSG